MVRIARALVAAVLGVVLAGPLSAAPCTAPGGGLGVSRIVEIDTTTGPLYGALSDLAREESFLAPKEVVLTFDDGPMPWITGSILDTLDAFCTKATFFSVGRMAVAYPATVKDVLARGHTLGTHTWSHPFNLPRSTIERATDEIEKGFAAVAMAAGEPISPFFRFPGLADSNGMLAHLQSRGVAAFTVDVVSNDSYIANPKRLIEAVVAETVRRNGGIILFHDIKTATAKALPSILAQLKERGFTIVHMRPKATYTPLADYDATLRPLIAKAAKVTGAKAHLVPFYGTVGPEKRALSDTVGAAGATPEMAPITSLAPVARERKSAHSESALRNRAPSQKLAVTGTPEPKALRGRTKKHSKAQSQNQPFSTFFD